MKTLISSIGEELKVRVKYEVSALSLLAFQLKGELI